MMRHCLFLVLCLATAAGLFAPRAAQARNCYTPAEAEAEQGIRIHSELMVIGLNCQHMTRPGIENLYVQYRRFTADHARLFAAYETELMNYYKRTGKSNPEGLLNDLRTAFANKISMDAARMRPDIFCSRYAARIPQARAMNAQAVKQWAGTLYASHPVSNPVCGQ